MTTDPSQVLDELVEERLGRSWDLQREQGGEVRTYYVSSPSGRRIELGQSYGVHLWLVLPQGWRVDTHADDLDSLVFEFSQFISLAEAILRDQVRVPHPEPDSRSRRWDIPEFGIVMRTA
ncbi:MAG TPA: hypothetical protein VFJ97_02080 [Dermatophilaceae bacterium]|nr:hypothetical protein [Dermatophilaceae bacterium]